MPEEPVLFASGMAQGPPEAVVYRGRWKLIVRTHPEEQVRYDLEADPAGRGAHSVDGISADDTNRR